MNEPDWIKNEAERTKREEEANDARAQDAIAASFRVAKEGPAFWQQLLAGLADNTNALPKIELAGRTSIIAAPEKGEQFCRVEVSKPGVFPNFTHTDLFYIPGAPVIRCRTLEGVEGGFVFRVLSSGEVVVVQDVDLMAMHPEQMAEFIVKRMATMIRRDIRQGA